MINPLSSARKSELVHLLLATMLLLSAPLRWLVKAHLVASGSNSGGAGLVAPGTAGLLDNFNQADFFIRHGLDDCAPDWGSAIDFTKKI